MRLLGFLGTPYSVSTSSRRELWRRLSISRSYRGLIVQFSRNCVGFVGQLRGLDMTASTGKQKTDKKFYAVIGGRENFYGITTTWKDCVKYVKGVRDCKYKSFFTYSEAESFVRQHDSGENPFSFVNDAGKRMVEVNSLASDKPPEQKRKADMLLASEGEFMPRADRAGIASSDPGEKRAKVSEKVIVYTDGACKANGTGHSVAGYGVFFGPEDSRNVSERLPGEMQTNNRAELMAVLIAMETLLEEGRNGDSRSAQIRTDSNYVMKGLTEWIHSWKRNGWKTSNQKSVKNRDLWEKMDKLNRTCQQFRPLSFEWVKGHGVDEGNNAADYLAVQGAEKAQQMN